jgi:hypothetical protein
MPETIPFNERGREAQILLAVVVPFVFGAIAGIGLLLAHAVAGTDAKVSLGGFPPLVIVIDAVVGALLAGLGGGLAGGARKPVVSVR